MYEVHWRTAFFSQLGENYQDAWRVWTLGHTRNC